MRGGRNLQGVKLTALQAKLRDLKYIVTDKLSMVSQAQFAWVGRRLRQATGQDKPFGDMYHINRGSRAAPTDKGSTASQSRPESTLNIEGFFR